MGNINTLLFMAAMLNKDQKNSNIEYYDANTNEYKSFVVKNQNRRKKKNKKRRG